MNHGKVNANKILKSGDKRFIILSVKNTTKINQHQNSDTLSLHGHMMSLWTVISAQMKDTTNWLWHESDLYEDCLDQK